MIVALFFAALGLAVLYDRHVERIAVNELSARLEQLAAAIEPGGDGLPRLVDEPGDPRFMRPFSGHYWQMQIGQLEMRSRSLWDHVLDLPPATPPGPSRSIVLAGPNGEALLGVDRVVAITKAASSTPIRITVALDRSELSELRHEFLSDLMPYTGLLAVVLIAAGGIQLFVGLRPLATISEKIAALNSGGERRLGTDLPDEVRPLAAEIDMLLAAGETETKRARQRAADLAHGLKTPLQALLAEAQLLRERGEDPAADGIEEIAVSMRQLVSRELARARVATRLPHGRADVREVLEAVVSVLRRAPLHSRITWNIVGQPAHPARIDQADLMEAVGALAENAGRHARSAVSLSMREVPGKIMVVIEDDGPGISDGDLENIRRRGVRLDTSYDGHGLGLPIASEIAEASGGKLELQNGSRGLKATLVLVAA